MSQSGANSTRRLLLRLLKKQADSIGINFSEPDTIISILLRQKSFLSLYGWMRSDDFREYLKEHFGYTIRLVE
jgi:hypothetical protein